MAFDGVEVGEVGKVGDADHGNVQHAFAGMLVQAGGQAVFVIQIQLGVGHHAHHGDAAHFLERGQAGAQNLNVAAELVDDQALHHGALVFVEQLHSAVQLREHAARIDVAYQQHGCLCHLGHAHVGQVVGLQVDFRRAACAFDDHDVEVLGKRVEGILHGRLQVGLVGVVVGRLHGIQHFSQHDHLAAHVARGL